MEARPLGLVFFDHLDAGQLIGQRLQPPTVQFPLYETEGGRTRVECRFVAETL